MWICSCLWKSWVIHHKGNNPKKIHRMWFHAEQPLWAAAPRLRATEQLPLGVRLPASSCVSTFRLFSVNELWMLCCDTNTSSLHLEGSVLSSVISYSFRSRVACNDNEHFQGSHTWRAVSHLSERMHLSNGRNTDSNINNTILSELLFKTLSHSHNKPPGFRRQILGSGKSGRWQMEQPLGWCAQGEAVVCIDWPVFATPPKPLLWNDLLIWAAHSNGSGRPGWQGDLRTLVKLRHRNMPAEPRAPSPACQLSSKSSKVDRSLNRKCVQWPAVSVLQFIQAEKHVHNTFSLITRV